jgi:hypothetical protein
MMAQRSMLVAAALAAACLVAPALAGLHDPPHPLDKFETASFATVINPAYSLTVNTTTYVGSGAGAGSAQNILVTVVGPGAAGDIIALYSPGNVDPTQFLFVKYITGSQITGYVGTGKGTYVFQLINLRSSYSFALITGGLNSNLQAPTFNIVAVSPTIVNTVPNQPTQGHLALTQDPTVVNIAWVTNNSSAPMAQWGLASGVYTGTSKATTVTYSVTDLCGGPANGTGYFTPGSLHTAVMSGLPPATKIHYRYGSSPDVAGLSQEYSFITAPLTGPNVSVKLLISADNGQGQPDGSNEAGAEEIPAIITTKGIAADIQSGYTLHVHNGDLAYADGYLVDWDQYGEQMALIGNYVPIMTVPGNHERDFPLTGDAFLNPGSTNSRGECGVVYTQRWGINMPQLPGQNASIMGRPFPLGIRSYYSFNYGPIHFLEWDTESPYLPGSLQHAFIAADLAAVDRTVTPWIIVGQHRMMYCDSSDYRSNDDSDQTVAAQIRYAFEDLFYQYNVTAVFYGHEHNYQRSCPTYKGACQATTSTVNTGVLGQYNTNTTSTYVNPSAPLYYLEGNAGRAATATSFLEAVTEPIWQNINVKFGYVRMRANGTVLITDAIEPSSGIIFDTVTIIKQAATAPSTAPPATTAAPSATTKAPATSAAPATTAAPSPPVTVLPPVTLAPVPPAEVPSKAQDITQGLTDITTGLVNKLNQG